MMLRELEGVRNSTRRPWLIIVVSVVLATTAVIWLVKKTDSAATPEKAAAAAVESGKAREKRSKRSAHRRAADSKATTEVVTPAAPLPPEAAARLAAAKADEAADRLCEARTNYLALLTSSDCEAVRPQVEQSLGRINITLTTTQRAMPEKIDYTIRSGDSIKLLARRFGSTAELIIRSNRIPNPDRIQIGDRLRILDKPRFEIFVSKSANDLRVTLNDNFFKRYTVGTGLYGRTPVGTFVIKDKLENPPWWKPDSTMIPFGDPENILGTRWMTLAATGETPAARGYGIHGTWDNSSLGQQSSAGCVRMANSDVEELFMLIPENTPVTIVD